MAHTTSRVRRVFLITLMMLGMAESESATLLDPSNPAEGFPTVVSTVKAASDRYNPDSIDKDREHYGVILRRAGIPARYFYTHAVAPRGRDDFRLRVPRGSGYHLVAIWHTHGRRDERHRYFSPQDARTANQLRLPFFLADYTGVLKVFRPGDPVLVRYGTSVIGPIAVGRIVESEDEQPVRILIRDMNTGRVAHTP